MAADMTLGSIGLQKMVPTATEIRILSMKAVLNITDN